MRKILFIILSVISVLSVEAQKVTFASEGFARGVKAHIGLAENEDVLQTQTDTITNIDLSGQEISSIYDVVWLPKVKRLDLSNNSIADVRPLAELDSLEWLDLRNNFLTDASLLAFTRVKKMTVNIGYNYIEDFTAFLMPGHCQFTMVGMNRQLKSEAEQFEIYQLYASVNGQGQPTVTYRGLTDMPSNVTLSVGEQSKIVLLDGTAYTVPVEVKGDKALKVLISNGTYEDSTFVVPANSYPSQPNESKIVETGLPEKYRIDNAGAKYGTVTIDGTKLHYTAPDENMPDMVAFSYYEGARFRGYSYFLAGLHLGDANGDGDVDIADAVCIVNYVVGKPNTTFIEAAADANGDGDIDIADAVHIVNYVVGKIQALAPRFEWNLPEPE